MAHKKIVRVKLDRVKYHELCIEGINALTQAERALRAALAMCEKVINADATDSDDDDGIIEELVSDSWHLEEAIQLIESAYENCPVGN